MVHYTYQLVLKASQSLFQVLDFGWFDGQGLNLLLCESGHVAHSVNVASMHQLH